MTTNIIPCDPAKAKAYRAKRQEPFGMITAGCMVHYAGPGQRQVVAQVGFDRRVQKPGQVYVREMVLAGETPVDCGWVDEPGAILIVNQAPRGSSARIMLSVGGIPFAWAPAGECIPPFYPVAGVIEKLTLSSSRDTPITMYAFPG